MTDGEQALSRVVDRIEWSWKHVKKYKRRFVSAKVGYHWQKVIKTDSKGVRYAEFIVDEAATLPDDLALIVGDAIHSLRACLDNMVYALHPSDYIEFPVCKSATIWDKQKWKIKDLPSGAIDRIFDLHRRSVDAPLVSSVAPKSHELKECP